MDIATHSAIKSTVMNSTFPRDGELHVKPPPVYILKSLIIGDLAVGKTSLIFRFTEDTFTTSYINTIGEKIIRKTMSM